MNELPVNRLREAIERVDLEDLEEVADAIGREAAQSALTQIAPPPVPREDPEQRYRERRAPLADAVEVVRRARERQGRRVCSAHDGGIIDQIFELLRSVMGPDGGADNDASFQ